MSFVDRNASDAKRLLRNAQRTRNGDATGSIKVNAPVTNTGTGLGLSLLSTGGLVLNTGQLSVKLADTTLALSASGVKVGTLTSANLPAAVAYTNVANTFSVQQNFAGGLSIQAFSGGSWIDIPTTGPSGLGSGGPGVNVWIAYSASNGQYFTTALAGDINIRNTAHNINVGMSGSTPSLVIDSSSANSNALTVFGFLGGLWLDIPVSGPSGIGSGGAGVNAWLAYSAGNGQFFTDALAGDINVRNSSPKRINLGTNAFSATIQLNGDTASITHVAGKNTAPSIAAGAGAGTTPTVSLSGTDLAGKVTVTTGTTPAASSVIVTITFNTAYGAAPYVVFSPANSNAAALSGTTAVYVTATTTTFVLNSGSAAVTAATTYVWNYVVIG